MKSAGDFLGKGGFTLVEMMLGAVLFGMVSVSVYGVFSQGMRVEKRLRDSTIAHQELFLAMETMAQELQRMVCYTGPDGAGGYLLGEAQKVSFVVADENGLKEIRYEIIEPEMDHIHRVEVRDMRSDDAGTRVVNQQETADRLFVLVEKRRNFPHYIGGEDGFEQKILTRKVRAEGLRFSYFIRDEQEKDEWMEHCTGDPWPQIVRIDLAVLSGETPEIHMIRDVFVPPPGDARGTNDGH